MSHTGNPRHPNNPPSDYPAEPTGAVTKDSLANESIQSGGAFGENENPEVLGVKGSQSTLNTTDTSNAEVLHPARSGAEREKQDALGLGSDERGTTGVRYPDADAGDNYGGTLSDQGFRGGSSQNYTGASTTSSSNYTSSNTGPDSNITSSGISTSGNTSTNTGGSTTGTRPYVESAPNYAATDNVRSDGTYKPKGDNLVEDGSDIPPNRSTFTGDVGGPKDPGRLAEQTFQKQAMDTSAGIQRDYGRAGDDGQENVYDNLNASERA